MVALTMAPHALRSFMFIIVFIVSFFVRTALSLIQYDRLALLEIRSSLKTEFFSTYRSACCDSFVLPPVCLPIRRRKRKKRGKRAGILCRSRTRYCNPPLPSILLANVQSLDNKLDELHARIEFQRDIANCCVLAFTETWLDPMVPDSAVTPTGFSIYRQDRTSESGKKRGGGVCLMVNSRWGSDVAALSAHCSPDLELLSIKVRPFYLPREFSSVIVTAVYIPPQADKTCALEELYRVINGLEDAHPEAVSIVVGDFNRTNMKKVLPKYYQHINFPTRGDQILDHCYSQIRKCYKPLPRPAFGKSDHTSIMLIPTYRQRLKQEKPVSRAVQRWSAEAISTLQDCFDTTDWQMFFVAADGDINEYTDSVSSYISKCIDDVVPRVSVRTFPNQKPWVNGNVRAKLKARSSAFNSGDQEALGKSRCDLRTAIRDAKREYRDKLESTYLSSDPRRLWGGLRHITGYKGRNSSDDQPAASLPDDLNTFYGRFEATNPLPSARLAEDQDDYTLSLTVADVRRELQRVNPRKSSGPDGVPGRVLRGCADQLAEVFTSIFNLSLHLSEVPTCFKQATIIPIPKKTSVTCLNDYRPVALTSTIMKCFERLVRTHICSTLPNTLDPFQFAYRPNRSTDDAIALATHATLSHLEKSNTYVRMLFVDYSSAFNTIVPAKLVPKLRGLGLKTPLCNWILDFLTSRPQVVRMGNHTSSSLTLSTGAPQGCVLSPLLYSLYTHDCVATHSSNIILKFADDTTILGLISNNDETAYRDEVRVLAEWCQDNNLSLNVCKTKEMIVDFRKLQRGGQDPIHIEGAEVERVSNFKFLGVYIKDDLTWSMQAGSAVKTAQKRLYFLRRLKKFGMSSKTLTNFYRCTIESILSGCITAWYGSCSAADRKALQRVVKTAERITGSHLPSVQGIYNSRCLRKAKKILKDNSHPGYGLFSLLPSGRRYRSIRTRTTRLTNSFFPLAVRLLNQKH